MKYQFVRFYALSALLLIGLVLCFGQLYNILFVAQHEKTMMLPQQALQQLISHPEKITLLTRSELALPSYLDAQLQSHGSLTVSEHAGSAALHYLYVLDEQDNTNVYQVGPLPLVKENGEEGLVFALFYGLLALGLLVLFKPLFNDLRRLQNAAVQYALDHKPIELITPKRSSIYPLAKSLSDMSQQISQFLQLHTDLSRILSHEIRTPLSRIQLAVSLMDEVDKEEREQIVNSLDEIEARLQQYLSFARIENQFAVYQMAAVDMPKLVDKVARKYQTYYTIQIRCDVQCHQVMAEAVSLEIALQNLIGNAVKYAHSLVEVIVTEHDNNYCICVQDDGDGLPVNAEDLLQPFIQGEQPALSSGYGLGLYIVQRIAKWHDGKITVGNSSTSGGASIEFVWPRTSAQ